MTSTATNQVAKTTAKVFGIVVASVLCALISSGMADANVTYATEAEAPQAITCQASDQLTNAYDSTELLVEVCGLN